MPARLVMLLAALVLLLGAAPAHAQDWDPGVWGNSLGFPGDWSGDTAPAAPAQPVVPTNYPALYSDGHAVVPADAPARVRAIMTAANHIVGKPYKWGGGHARLEDRGYDCSGSVGYALIKAGLLGGPMTSGQFARWGAKGPGRWVTIYANRGHVYMEVAGLRFDTSGGGGSGPRFQPPIGQRPGFKVRHPLGL